MKKIIPCIDWDSSWKHSYQCDLLEIYGERKKSGYSYAYANRSKHTLKIIQEIAQPGEAVLDLAAAQGNFSLALAELGYTVTWNDLREDLVNYVELKRENGVINYQPGNIFDLNVNSKFSVVLLAEIIEHVAHPDQFLKKISSLIEPGGYIVMTTPNGEYFRNNLPKFSECPDPEKFEAMQFQPDSDGHIFLLHIDEIKEIAREANLELLKLDLITNPLTNGHVKLHKVLPFLPSSFVHGLEKVTRSLPITIRRKVHTCTIALLRKPKESCSL